MPLFQMLHPKTLELSNLAILLVEPYLQRNRGPLHRIWRHPAVFPRPLLSLNIFRTFSRRNQFTSTTRRTKREGITYKDMAGINCSRWLELTGTGNVFRVFAAFAF